MVRTHRPPFPSIVSLAPAGLFALATLGWSPSADACSCVPPPEPAKAMADSKAVFEGKLVSQRTEMRSLGAEGDTAGGPALPINVATFEVLRVWKGDGIAVGSTVTIETQGDSAACGRDYSSATEWIVYAYDQDGNFGDGLCTRTGPSDAAANDGDAAALDAVVNGSGDLGPTAGGVPPETDASKSGCTLAGPDTNPTGTAGFLAIVLACVWLPTRRTTRTVRR